MGRTRKSSHHSQSDIAFSHDLGPIVWIISKLLRAEPWHHHLKCLIKMFAIEPRSAPEDLRHPCKRIHSHLFQKVQHIKWNPVFTDQTFMMKIKIHHAHEDGLSAGR